MIAVGLQHFRDNREKARYMTDEAIKDARHSRVQQWASEFLKVRPGATRAAAILRFCQYAIDYVRDPREEVLESADVVLLRGYGDCDAKQRLFVALCTACGIAARALPVFRGLNAERFPHVLAEVLLDGRWYRADPTILNSLINAIPSASHAITNYW
jgi:transglutaminase-like putative cysteine protease